MSRKTGTLLCLIAGSMMLIIGCSKSSEDRLTTPIPPSDCDTVNMTYSSDVQPILEANCYSCHGNGNVNGGVTLDSYTGVKLVADNGLLIGVITHAPGYPPMPDGGGKLSDCDINKIKDWINRGASNN
ncbi:cytochrome c [Ilyomonas limi]|uniref:Cytochrome c n=1 Tax=Ilyomonas limi TaxID=2575867 RepID=A0A4V5UU47_9BACT|nr:cytochrome c [Ilyomonas limi]TKK67673.1 cytochrome c [Ilyomonas limi]